MQLNHFICISHIKRGIIKHNIHRLVSESLEIIEDTVKRYNDYDMWVLTSTGKDSTVTLDLVRKIVPTIKVMFHSFSSFKPCFKLAINIFFVFRNIDT